MFNHSLNPFRHPADSLAKNSLPASLMQAAQAKPCQRLALTESVCCYTCSLRFCAAAANLRALLIELVAMTLLDTASLKQLGMTLLLTLFSALPLRLCVAIGISRLGFRRGLAAGLPLPLCCWRFKLSGGFQNLCSLFTFSALMPSLRRAEVA